MATLWTALVWAGQFFYFSRFLLQWVLAEKAKRSVAPRAFWWCSMAGVLLAGTGAIGQGEWVLVPAFLINGALYTRNLMLADSEEERARPGGLGPLPAAAAGLVAAGVALWLGLHYTDFEVGMALPWLACGIGGQAVWSTRFLVQWWYSERQGRAHFPLGFWWLSLVGAMLNLAYTAQLGKPEFLVAYLIAWFVPARNLLLEYRRRS